MIRRLAVVAVGCVLVALAPGRVFAQSRDTMKESHHGKSPWKELDAFHAVMAATWHPAQSKGDLAPARARAAELLASAEAWAASAVPKECGKPDTKARLEKLVANAKIVASQAARTGNDAELKASVKTLHDDFEEGLEASCSAARGHDAKHR